MKKITMFVISLGIVFTFGGVAFGDIIHVPSEYSTIQAGIDAASNGDTVLVADGVYMGEGNRDLVFGGKIITVQSENGPVKSIIDCEGVGRAFSSYPNSSIRDVVFRGFTIKNGVANGGGAIYWGYTSADLTVVDCIFYNNSNTAIRTYALKDDSTVTISNCDFIGNEEAVYPMFGGNAVITNCYFYGNTSTVRGGAIRATGGTTTDIKNCIFTDNISDYDAGAISFEYGNHRLANCIFAGNRAGGRGGAIYTSQLFIPDNSLTIINCTFSDNEAENGGAIWLSSNSFPTISNSILWNNTPDEISGDGVPTVTYSDIQGGYIGEGNMEDAPFFMDITDPDPVNWNLRLRSNSPCIDEGDNNAPGLPINDLDAKPRIIDGDSDIIATVDMGAYEYGDICEGDFDEDSDVDGSDLAVFAADFGRTDCGVPTTCPGDFDNDGDVDGSDLAIFAADFGRTDCPVYY
jgi:predicted outer membrane repeat protein